ncbi:MAG: PadR family transcriptional regulator [Acidiphilium sp.]|nr:PadR family transcriptional regulator [Acidiphilium sp.]MDD4936235.1 PadR family transcriptional regulator [Acidiphilium sp.]
MNLFERMMAAHDGRHANGCAGRRFAFGGRCGPDQGGPRQGRFGGGGRFGRDGRLRRLLEHGDLRLLVLHLIGEKPRHGYEIIKAIEDLAGGAYAPSPGVVYPTLSMLEDLGQVSGETEGSRKSFTITEAGRVELAANRAEVEVILARIAAAQAHEPALPVVRAMENLKTALRLKLATGIAAPEVARRIADAIDQAARTIEDL